MTTVAKIKKVFLDDLSGNGKTDVSLAIHLDNGRQITLNLNEKQNDPRFKKIFESNYAGDPETDGLRLFWPDGPEFTLGEIFGILKNESGGKITGVYAYEGKPDEIDIFLSGGHSVSLKYPAAGGKPEVVKNRVIWPDGPSLGLKEILKLVRDGRKTPVKPSPARRLVYLAAACAAAVLIIYASGVTLNPVNYETLILMEETVPLAAPEIIPTVKIPANESGIDPQIFNGLFENVEDYILIKIVLTETGEILYEADGDANKKFIQTPEGRHLAELTLMRPIGANNEQIEKVLRIIILVE